MQRKLRVRDRHTREAQPYKTENVVRSSLVGRLNLE